MGTRRDFYWKGGVVGHEGDPTYPANWYNRDLDQVWNVEPGQAPETYDDYLRFDATYDGRMAPVDPPVLAGWSATLKHVEAYLTNYLMQGVTEVMVAGMTAETVGIANGIMSGGTVTGAAAFSGDGPAWGIMTGGTVTGAATFEYGAQFLGGTCGSAVIDCSGALSPMDQGPGTITGDLTLIGYLLATIAGLDVGGDAFLDEILETPAAGVAVTAAGKIRIERSSVTNQAIFETPLLVVDKGCSFPTGLDANGVIRILGVSAANDCSGGISSQTRIEVYGKLVVDTEAIMGQTDSVDLMTPVAEVMHPLYNAAVRASRMPQGGILRV